MIFSKSIHTIDMHCGGEPFRIITGGIPHLFGSTIHEKIDFLKENHDWVVKLAMLGPSGLPCGAIITEPTVEGADVGIIHIDTGGFSPMCGHGTLALGKAIVELGMVDKKEPETKVVMDTPAGIVTTYAKVENGQVIEVSFEGVPSFLYQKDIKLDVPSLGEITVDIAYGGNFFLMVDIEPLGLEISRKKMQPMANLAAEILEVANTQLFVVHPENPDITLLEALLFCEAPKSEGAPHRLLDIYGDRIADFSPCGTGTCARMAREYNYGRLGLNQKFVNEGPVGAQFIGCIAKETKVGDFPAIVPVLSSKAHFMSFTQLLVEEEDPFKYGY